MRSYIENIVLLCNDDTIRNIKLKKGVNIISGESKTGKSALAEIIDYCLCCTIGAIPKGIITESVSVYILRLKIGGCSYLVARRKTGAGSNGKMFFIKVEDDFDIDVEINAAFFENKNELSVKDACAMIESTLGLTITDMPLIGSNKGKASLRNMMPFILQHQNIIANKHILFYRFADPNKRKESIDQFPVFAGFANQKYYSLLVEIEKCRKQLRALEKQEEGNKKSVDYTKNKLAPLLKTYFELVNSDPGFDIDEAKTPTLLRTAKDLPVVKEEDLFGVSELIQEKKSVLKSIDSLENKILSLEGKRSLYQTAEDQGVDYKTSINELKGDVLALTETITSCQCPLCGQEYVGIDHENEKIDQAKKWLDSELRITTNYLKSFDEDEAIISAELEDAKEELRTKKEALRQINNSIFEDKENKKLLDKIRDLKSKIEIFAEVSDKGLFNEGVDQIPALRSKITQLKENLETFSVEKRLEEAQTFINTNMNLLAKGLDFEEEYKPINLSFSLCSGDFDIALRSGDMEVSLGEMGSGANWLSCHVALFLSFLRFFASRQKCPMLLTMFFDQPSQVYFPTDHFESNETNSDMAAITSIYKTIIDEVNSIMVDCDTDVQLIITDHINLAERYQGFKDNLVDEWRSGRKLI